MLHAHGENSDEDMKNLRRRWAASIVGDPDANVSDPLVLTCIDRQSEKARVLWKAMNKNPQSDLWPSLNTAHNSAGLTATVKNLSLLAAAYATKGSRLYHAKALRDDITTGLSWFLTNRYTVQSTQYGNWWDWHIGVPIQLNPLLACLYDDLLPPLMKRATDASAHFTPTIWATGANGTWRADIILKRSILIGDKTGVQIAQKWMSETMLRYSDAPADPIHHGYAEGFYHDGSFFAHDRHPYNGGYGHAALESAAHLLALLHGSPWAVDGPEQHNIYRWFFDSYVPFLYRGTLFENTVGREISRSNAKGSAAGTIKILLPLIEAAPALYKTRLQGYAKAIASPDIYSTLNVPEIVAVQMLLNDPSIQPAPPTVLFKHFPLIARTSVLRPTFGASVSMYSDTTYDYEYLNGENHKGWHTSDGWLQIADGDAAQFRDGYWPTVNWHRLPGTTVVQNQEKPSNARNGSNWAGGATLDGMNGVTGFELKPGFCSRRDGQSQKILSETDGQTVTARKSWFLLGEEIVCVGSDISASAALPVETIIENRRLAGAGENTLLIDGVPQQLIFGTPQTMAAHWMHLAGNAPHSDLGFVFPRETQVQVLRETRTGSWREINDSGSDDKIIRHYLTLWINHGPKPAKGTYAYIILPGKSAAAVAQYAENLDIQILAQTAAVHAVQSKSLDIVAANFWEDAPVTVPWGGTDWLSCDRKACVIVRRQGKVLSAAVSDPTRVNTRSIILKLAGTTRKVLTKSARIQIQELPDETVVTLNLSNMSADERGQTFHVSLAE